jgi:hypothetical protein
MNIAGHGVSSGPEGICRERLQQILKSQRTEAILQLMAVRDPGTKFRPGIVIE